jgi:hypothetical protein
VASTSASFGPPLPIPPPRRTVLVCCGNQSPCKETILPYIKKNDGKNDEEGEKKEFETDMYEHIKDIQFCLFKYCRQTDKFNQSAYSVSNLVRI